MLLMMADLILLVQRIISCITELVGICRYTSFAILDHSTGGDHALPGAYGNERSVQCIGRFRNRLQCNFL
jgi:hypothetical protein